MENPEDEKICKACSAQLPFVPDLPPEVKTSKLAIWSFVLALLGICTFNLTALPAIICGIIGLVKIHGSSGRLKGKGFAISGIVIPVVLFILLCALGMLMAVMMPAMGRARQVAQYTICSTNLKGLGGSMVVYVQDYNSYPPADKWCEELISKADSAPQQFLCPADAKQDGVSSYAFNINLSGVNPADVPPDTVLLFETTAGVNPVGGAEILNTERHQNEGCNVLFADGHVKFVKKEELETLKWKP
jgi:prepilin-type processing-associated H-X9-DG protein